MIDLIEQQIRDKKLNAPRVTPADIEAEIFSEFYFTAAEGAHVRFCEFHGDNPWTRGNEALERLTFCVLVLRNGFTVTGESACVSPENFDAEIGRKIARQNAMAKIWPLLGFRLADKLKAERAGPRYRDAGSGEYVTAEYAAANPATTVRETS